MLEGKNKRYEITFFALTVFLVLSGFLVSAEEEVRNGRAYITNGEDTYFADEVTEEMLSDQFGVKSFVGEESVSILSEKKEESVPKQAGYLVQLSEKPVLVYRKELSQRAEGNKKRIEEMSAYNPAKYALKAVTLQPKDVPAKVMKQEERILEEQREISEKIKNEFSQYRGITGRVVDSEENGEIVVGELKGLVNALLINVSDEEARNVKEINGVVAVYPNKLNKLMLMDSVPAIDADAVWQMPDGKGNGLTGKGMKIAIIDTGVDYTHPDFGKCTTEQFLEKKCEKVIGGHDFSGNSVSEKNEIVEDTDPMDFEGHGTHVASTAAGNGQLRGVAPEAQILAYKVFPSAYDSVIIKAIEQAIKDGADVISMSLGKNCWNYDEECGPDDLISQASDNAVNAGAIVIVAAGNSGPRANTIGSPATARKVITVGATYSKDYEGEYHEANPRKNKVTSFSSRGPVKVENDGKEEIIEKPDVVAPGAYICAARYGLIFEEGEHPFYKPCFDEKHVLLAGTSMAAPHVAGFAALLQQANPGAEPLEIKKLMKEKAIDLKLEKNVQGAGLINGLQALEGRFSVLVEPSYGIIEIVPEQKVSVGKKSFTIDNKGSEEESFILNVETTGGIKATLSEPRVTLAAGEKKEIIVNVEVDVDVLEEEKVYEGKIIVQKGRGIVAIVPFGVRVLTSTVFDIRKIDLGLDIPSLAMWDKEQKIQITNVRKDKERKFSMQIEIDSYESYSNGELNNGPVPTEVRGMVSISPERITLAPGGSETFAVNAKVDNSKLPDGIYGAKVVIVSEDGFREELPLKFVKYHTLTINVPNKNHQVAVAYFINNGNVVRIGDYREGKPSYLSETGEGTLFLLGINHGRGLTIYAKPVTIEGESVMNIDLEEAKNSIAFSLKDKQGNMVPSILIGLLVPRYKGEGKFWTSMFFDWSQEDKMIYSSDLPEDLTLDFVVANFCNGRDKYVPHFVGRPEGDVIVTNNPEDDIEAIITYASPKGEEFMIEDGVTFSDNEWRVGCYNKRELFQSGEGKSVFMSTREEDKVLLKTSIFSEELPVVQSPYYRVNNDKVVLIPYGVEEEILEKNAFSVGLGPSIWQGKMVANSKGVYILGKDYSNWLFFRQRYGRASYDEVPVRVRDSEGKIVYEGNLAAHGIYGAYPPLDFISWENEGVYDIEIEHTYDINRKTYAGIVGARFDSRIMVQTENLPSLRKLKVLCDDVECESLHGTERKIVFEFEDYGIGTTSVGVAYELNGKWVNLETRQEGTALISMLPEFTGEKVRLRVETENSRGSKLSYSFELPIGRSSTKEPAPSPEPTPKPSPGEGERRNETPITPVPPAPTPTPPTKNGSTPTPPTSSGAICDDQEPNDAFGVAGIAIYQGTTYADKCEERGASVRQYFCEGDKLRSSVKRCPNGGTCSAGVCR